VKAPQLRHYRLLPNPSQFISHSTIGRYNPKEIKSLETSRTQTWSTYIPD
jgi:hypothetical protein